ncbi:MAG: aminoglycoside phosphotransferase, partial [Proteobacteria bacterium]|nr:aminoglycoside phosphotransferase [Pseudomonadota bacterium]
MPSGFDAALIPPSLDGLRGSEGARSWFDALPRLVDECVEEWSIRIGDPYPGSHVSLVLPAILPDATDAVLKIQFPHRECEHEAAALGVWNGDGAVRLLAHNAERHALLVERCTPGSHLRERGAEDALSVLIDLLPRLWKPTTGPIETLAREAARWAVNLPQHWEDSGRPFERELLDAAVNALETLPSSQGEPVLLHQDLHPDNV